MGDFEQIPEIAERIKRSKMELQDNGNYWAPEWDSQSCCDQDFVNNFKKGWQYQQAIIDEHTEVIKLQDTDLRKYEKQIENLKEQLNNMEQCYIGKKKQVDGLQGRIGEYGRLTTSIRNEFDLWSDDSEFADVIEAQIENFEALRGEL